MTNVARRFGPFSSLHLASVSFSRIPNFLFCGKLLLSFLLFACTSLCLTEVAQAQYRTSIQGTVTDPSGAVVQGATVTLTNNETNQTLQATTTNSGVYTFNALPPSTYTITVEKAGFQKQVLDHLQVIAEQANAVNVQLAVGETTQTVTVNGAEAPAIDTETGSISGTINNLEVQQMPSFGRDVFQLAQLAPGAFGDGSQGAGGGTNNLPNQAGPGGSGSNSGIFQTENRPQVIANGNAMETNNITIDGVSVNSITWAGAAVITPSEESVKEVKVITNDYDAENGRFGGAQIQVISKNGTNNWHGSAFFRMNRPGLNAYQTWNGPFSYATPTNTTAADRGLQRDTGRFNTWGGSVGGPIVKNKLFGFFAIERLTNGSVGTATGWYTTPQFAALARSGSIASQFLSYPGEAVPSYSSILPATCAGIGLAEGVNCRTIPGQGLNVGSPLTTPLGTLDPTFGGVGTPGVGSGLSNVADIFEVATTNPTTNVNTQYNGRIDWNPTSKDLIAGSFYWVPSSTTNYNGPVRPANLWNHDQTNNAFTALWDHTFSNSLLNEVRFNAAGWRWNEIATNGQEPWGLPTDNLTPLNQSSAYGGNLIQSFGAPGPSVFDQWTYNIADKVTKVHNTHNFKFGGEVTRLEFLDEAPWSARPQYYFNNIWDFLNDAPSGENGNFNPLTGEPTSVRKDMRSNVWGLFAQDSWRVRPTLTLNLGLRWEYFGSLYSKENNTSRLVLGPTTDTALSGMHLVEGGNLWNAPGSNFGPQIGFAWSPEKFGGKTVIRGGFGLGYSGLEEAISLNGRDNPPIVVAPNLFATGPVSTSPILYSTADNIHNFNGYPSNPSTISAFGPNNLPLNGTTTVTGFPSTLSTMYNYRYSLEIQHEFDYQWVFTIGYQGNTAHHMTRQYDENIQYGVAGAPLNPTVNQVDWYANDGNSNYNALLVDLRHGFTRYFQFEANYAWSKLMDNASEPYWEDPYQWVPAASWGPSDYNVTNAFKAYGVFQAPWFQGQHNWEGQILGGWILSGILNWHSGFPWTPVYSPGSIIYSGSPDSTLRPGNQIAGFNVNTSNSSFMSGPSNGPNPSTSNSNFPNGGLAYYTAPPLPVPPFPGIGVVPPISPVIRNTLPGPHYFDVDATLSKVFGAPHIPGLGEGAQFQIRASFFNLFNNLNLKGGGSSSGGGISNFITSNNFGQAQNALGSRTVTFEFRFQF
jgi:Carboxypeptidase regulatory-like domain/TonB dependent receptor-like, beta-barrel